MNETKRNLSFSKIGLLIIMLLVLRLSASGFMEKVDVFQEWDDIREMAVINNYVYAANGKQGLLILDASTPSKPTRVKLDNILIFKSTYIFDVNCFNGKSIL